MMAGRGIFTTRGLTEMREHQDRDDERLKRDEMRHRDELTRWGCMGLV